MGFITATVTGRNGGNFLAGTRIFWAFATSGFHRYATYRQATVAAAITNTMFGFLRTYVLLAVTATVGVAAGYTGPQLITYVWVGQGLIGVVLFWGWFDLADRIRTGDVVTDLLRPVHPVLSYLAADLGRAAYAALTRFTVPMVVGALVFDLYLPKRPLSYLLFSISTLLAFVVCFGCRYLMNATAFWLLDLRGPAMIWALFSGALSGLYFPLRFLPEWLVITLWLATPFPSILQTPIDVLVERVPPGRQLALIGLQAVWAVLVLAACALVQRRAERRFGDPGWLR